MSARLIVFEDSIPGKVLGLCVSLASFLGQAYLVYRLRASLNERFGGLNKPSSGEKEYPKMLKTTVFSAMIIGVCYAFYSIIMNVVFLSGGSFDFRFCWGRILWFFANKGFLYLFFVERVNYTLKDSAYHISEKLVWFLRAAIVLWNGNSIILGIAVVRGTRSCNYAPYWVAQAVLCDLVFSITSVMLFVCGLRKLALALQSTSKSDKTERMTSKLMMICVKHMILATTAITATWLFSAVLASVLTDMVSTFGTIDVFINTWSIYASFVFNSDTYLMVCSCWDRCCVRCCFGFYHVNIEEAMRSQALDTIQSNSIPQATLGSSSPRSVGDSSIGNSTMTSSRSTD